MSPVLSVIVPTLNEGAVIESLLRELQPLRQAGCELIVSDAGSADDTCVLAGQLADKVVSGTAGRALQMNRGAEAAAGDWLWFVHADTRFQHPTIEFLELFRRMSSDWGFFAVRLDADGASYRLIETLMNIRSRFSRVGTGDQGLFVRRELFEQLHGFALIPLMEDVELSKRLRRLSAPRFVARPLLTSARRWQRQGMVHTILLMWRLRLAYFLGVSPQRLAKHYRVCSSPTHES